MIGLISRFLGAGAGKESRGEGTCPEEDASDLGPKRFAGTAASRRQPIEWEVERDSELRTLVKPLTPSEENLTLGFVLFFIFL